MNTIYFCYQRNITNHRRQVIEPYSGAYVKGVRGQLCWNGEIDIIQFYFPFSMKKWTSNLNAWLSALSDRFGLFNSTLCQRWPLLLKKWRWNVFMLKHRTYFDIFFQLSLFLTLYENPSSIMKRLMLFFCFIKQSICLNFYR